MFRKLLVAAVASAGLVFPMVASADYHDYRGERRDGRSDHRQERRHDHSYRVFFRHDVHCPWTTSSAFLSRRNAEHFAETYRCQGFEVFIR